MAGDESLRALREALSHSPDNVLLRRPLAETLLAFGRTDEAEEEFREALGRDRDHVELKLGLARTFHQQGKLAELFDLEDRDLNLDWSWHKPGSRIVAQTDDAAADQSRRLRWFDLSTSVSY